MNSLIGEHGVFRGGQNVGTVTVSEDGRMTAITCSCDIITGGVLRLAAVSGDEFVSIGVVAPEAGRLRLKKSYTKGALSALRLDDGTSFYLILPGETLHELKTGEEANAVKLTLGARSATPEPEPEIGLDNEAELASEPVPEPEPEPEAEPEIEPAPEEIKPAPPEIAREYDAPSVPQLSPAAPPPEPPHEEPAFPPVLPKQESAPDIARELGEWKPIRDPAALFSDGDIADACRGAHGALTMERGGFLMLAIPVNADEPFPMMPVFCFGISETIAGGEYIVFKTKNGNLAV